MKDRGMHRIFMYTKSSSPVTYVYVPVVDSTAVCGRSTVRVVFFLCLLSAGRWLCSALKPFYAQYRRLVALSDI